MPLHIDEIQTDVQLSAQEGTPSAAEQAPAWKQLALQRCLQEQLLEEDARTCATGNHD